MRNLIACRHAVLCSLLVHLASPPVQLPAQAAAAAESAPVTLRAVSRIVYVDAVVRDGAGNVVHGLPATAFTVQENGRAQKVALFTEHNGRKEQLAGERPAPRPGVYSNIAPDAQDTSLNMVLLDLLNTAPQDQAYARKRMIAFLKALPPHRQVALFVLGTRLRMIQGFTTDAADLVRAAEAIDIRQENKLRTPNQQVWDADYADYLSREAGGGGRAAPGFAASAMLLQNSLLEDLNNMKARLDTANRAFSELARAVNGYPGRKNLFWLAGQFPSSTYYELQTMTETAAPANGTPLGSGRLQAQQLAGSAAAAGLNLQLFSDRANRAISDSQIAVYPISVVGVQTDAVGAEQMGSATTGPGSSADTAALFFNERQTGRAVMQDIAARTGGEAFYGNNDVKGLLNRAFEDGDNYYTLAYQPTDHDWNGKYRAIKVALAPGGYQLSYRRGYFALPAQPVRNVLQSFAESMRVEAPPATMLVVQAAAPKQPADGPTTVPVTLDLRGVAFALDAASGDRSAKLQVMAIAYPELRQMSPVQSNSALSLRLERADYEKALQAGIPVPLPLALAPGRYAIRVGVVDLTSGRIGTLTVPYVAHGPSVDQHPQAE